MTKIWLIRHGEPVEEAQQRCYGSLDVGLCERGRAQMQRTAERLRSAGISGIYSSPRLRATESAQIIADATGCSVQVAPNLREIHFGDFEGMTYDDIAAGYPELYALWMRTPTQVRFPNGENFHDMRARVLRVFEEIRRKHDGDTIVMVSHGGVNRILLAWILGMPDEYLFRLAQDYGAVNLVAFRGGVPEIELMNQRWI